MRKYFYIIILVIILLFLYAKYIEPNNLIVNEYSVYTENIDDSYNDFKIMQFSDLLYSGNSDNKMLQKIVNKINMYRPDIVIFTGNLFNENYNLNDEDEKYIEEELNNITVNISKIAIFGSNDNNNQNQYQNIMNNSNFIILNNSSKYVFYKSNRPLEITNVDNFENINKVFLNEENIDPCYEIILLQKPDDIENILATNLDVDLLLSGYSLGGIVNLPFIGPLMKKDGAKTYINGYYKVDGYNLYVNNGIGVNNYKIRLFNTPSINLYRLTNKN